MRLSERLLCASYLHFFTIRDCDVPRPSNAAPPACASLFLSSSLQLLHVELVPPLRFVNKIATRIKQYALFFQQLPF
jgi:hypothetical protein